jgi:serpin B
VIHTIEEAAGIILVNAIYFKGTWEKEFKEKDTKDEDFNLISGEKILIPMMYQKGKFRWLKEDEFQILELPYKGARIFGTLEHISMIVFLPKNFNGIGKLEKNLTQDKINSYLEKLHKVWEREIKIFIPKFKIEKKYELLKTLYDLGMTNAFSDGADFSRISEDPPRYISQIIHKAFVEVNERGTEAAAVTAVVMLGAAMGMSKPEEFRADHPFLFLLIDSYSRSILFIGRVMNPRS